MTNEEIKTLLDEIRASQQAVERIAVAVQEQLGPVLEGIKNSPLGSMFGM